MASVTGQPSVVRVGDAAFHVRRDGPWTTDAPALVFANSLGTDFRVWDALLGELAGRYRVLRYDKRGHGLSTLTPGPYAMDDLVGDLAALMDAEDLQDAVVVGLSIGGMIAQGLAAARPDLVSGLVLMDTAHKIGTDEIWDERIAAVRAGGVEAIADAVMTRWFTPTFHARRADELGLWRTMLVRTPVEGYLGCSLAIRNADLTEATSGLALPTLCMAGDQDGSTPVDVVRATAELIVGARMEVVVDAGHLPGVEQPQAVARLVEDFLRDMGHG